MSRLAVFEASSTRPKTLAHGCKRHLLAFCSSTPGSFSPRIGAPAPGRGHQLCEVASKAPVRRDDRRRLQQLPRGKYNGALQCVPSTRPEHGDGHKVNNGMVLQFCAKQRMRKLCLIYRASSEALASERGSARDDRRLPQHVLLEAQMGMTWKQHTQSAVQVPRLRVEAHVAVATGTSDTLRWCKS